MFNSFSYYYECDYDDFCLRMVSDHCASEECLRDNFNGKPTAINATILWHPNCPIDLFSEADYELLYYLGSPPKMPKFIKDFLKINKYLERQGSLDENF